jgi:hypothetical protein
MIRNLVIPSPFPLVVAVVFFGLMFTGTVPHNPSDLAPRVKEIHGTETDTDR